MTTQRNKSGKPSAKPTPAQARKLKAPKVSVGGALGKKAQSPARTAEKTPNGKIGALVVLLRRPNGATIADLCKETGWQAHSVRGALSGTIKKKLALQLQSEKMEAGRVYRIAK